jgi:creatinine amidohydrolase
MIYADLTSEDIARIAPGTVAVLPLAAIEQHGFHLPVVTDTAIATELGRRVEKALDSKVVLLPTLWAGSSHHHLAFKGTLSISSETYVRVLCDLLESLLAAGFRRIFLLNGHGGNQTPFAEALYRIGLQRPGAWIAAQSYWKLAAAELSAQDFMETPALSHACEYETSLMLALKPEKVRMERAQGCVTPRNSAFYDPLGYGPSVVEVVETFDRMTPHGAMGSPELGTPEKGQRLLELITRKLTEFLCEFAEWAEPLKRELAGPAQPPWTS